MEPSESIAKPISRRIETILFGSMRRAFVNCGHEVFIYILSYGLPELREISEGLSVRFLPLPQWLRAVDAFLWRLRSLKHGASLRDQTAYLAYGRGLQSALREDRIDVLYHQEIWTARFDIVSGKTKLPVVGADHGAVFSDWMTPAKRHSFKRAARLICQSHTGLKRARSFGANAVFMPNGVDTSFFVPPESSQLRQKTVLAVGRLVEEQKRFSDLLRAMQSLPDFRLILVGSGPDEIRLRKLAADLGLIERVSLCRFRLRSEGIAASLPGVWRFCFNLELGGGCTRDVGGHELRRPGSRYAHSLIRGSAH